MIVLNVYYYTKPGMRQEFFDKVNEAGAPVLSRKEEGNIRYDYFFSEANENELLLVEHWKDEAAFEFHKVQEHFAKLQEIKAVYVDEVKLDRFDV